MKVCEKEEVEEHVELERHFEYEQPHRPEIISQC
jgi:hypothetical protein